LSASQVWSVQNGDSQLYKKLQIRGIFLQSNPPNVSNTEVQKALTLG